MTRSIIVSYIKKRKKKKTREKVSGRLRTHGNTVEQSTLPNARIRQSLRRKMRNVSELVGCPSSTILQSEIRYYYYYLIELRWKKMTKLKISYTL